MRFAIVTLALTFAAANAFFACSGPHSGKSEKLKKPRKKERPEEADTTQVEDKPLDTTECATNFFAEPTKRRKQRDGERLANEADGIMAEADRNEGDKRQALLVEALDKLANALKKDPYGPIPTYKMAVAYAIAGRKSCSIALLERLATLQKHPDVEKIASRTVQRALRDPAFKKFSKEAKKALGE